MRSRANNLEKTSICRYFSNQGWCTMGARCSFAHSSQELRVRPDLSRTKVCTRLIDTGKCDDPNCQFAHNAGEFRGRISLHHEQKLVHGGGIHEYTAAPRWPRVDASTLGFRRFDPNQAVTAENMALSVRASEAQLHHRYLQSLLLQAVHRPQGESPKGGFVDQPQLEDVPLPFKLNAPLDSSANHMACDSSLCQSYTDIFIPMKVAPAFSSPEADPYIALRMSF